MEIWKPIEGTEGIYKVSNTGKVRSNNYLGHGKQGEIKKVKDQKGYLRANIYFKGKKITLKVHREVAKAFIPNLENKPEVNHINGIKDDNRVENLEWVTASENTRHAYANGLKEKTREHAKRMGLSQVKNLAKYRELQMTPIIAIKVETGEKIQFKSQAEASKQLEVPQPNIHKVLSNKRKTAGGYKFEYID